MASSIPNYMPIIKDVVKQQDVRYLSLFEPPPFAKADDIHFFVTSALGMDSEVSLLPGKMPIIQRKGPAFGILDSLFWLIGKQS